jgi:hypothetical protein
MMTELDPKKNAPQQKPREATPTSKKAPKGDYLVGKWRPPVETRWQPGQSGNPRGRRKGRRNVRTELREIACKKITVRDGEMEREVTLLGANVLAHGVKGAKGDVRSAGLFLNHAYRMKLLDEEDAAVIESAERDSREGGVVLRTSASKSRPSDTLFENLDLQLLAREELTELARLAEIIDLGGDITALSTADFERMKHIVNRGRGKDITQQ